MPRLSIFENEALSISIGRAMKYFQIRSKTAFYQMAARHWLMEHPIPDLDDSQNGQVNVADLAGIVHQLGKNGQIRAVSDGWCAAFKLKREDVEGRSLSDFLSEDSKVDHLANMNIAIKNRPETFTRDIICGDGVTIKKVRIELKRKYGRLGELVSVMSNLTVLDE